MIVVRDPILNPVAIPTLRPTQITVGLREVEEGATGCPSTNRKRSESFLAIT